LFLTFALYTPSNTLLNVKPFGSTLSLAVKHRPVSFETVVGQRHVTEVLRRAVLARRVPQQLLFSGRSGLGKTTIARIVAAAMLCETSMEKRSNADVCGNCTSCKDAFNPQGFHPDIIEFDAASYGGKDEIRDIASRAQIAPLRSDLKIYIIDEAHGLSHAGGQAFLKLLEEPPSHVVFMLCTTDPEKMLKTNRGRCVEFEMLSPTRRELVKNLNRIVELESWTLDEGVLDLVIDGSDPDLGVRGTVGALAKLGSVLDAQETLSIDEAALLLGMPPVKLIGDLYEKIVSWETQEALKALARVRTTSSDASIHRQLQSLLEKDLLKALSESNTEGVTLHLRRLEQTLASPGTSSHLDVLVAALSSFDKPPMPASVLIEDAKSVLNELNIQLAKARKEQPTVSEKTVSTRNGSSTLSPDASRLYAAMDTNDPNLRALLARCKVTIDAQRVTMVAPDEITEALKPFGKDLRTGAGRLGLPFTAFKESSYKQR